MNDIEQRNEHRASSGLVNEVGGSEFHLYDGGKLLEGTEHRLTAIYKRFSKLEKCFHVARSEEGPQKENHCR